MGRREEREKQGGNETPRCQHNHLDYVGSLGSEDTSQLSPVGKKTSTAFYFKAEFKT